MKKKDLILGFCLAIQSVVWGQDYAHDFGKFNVQEVAMLSYNGDKEAEAVVLHDIGNTLFNYDDVKGFEIIFQRNTKIKMLSKAGLKYAEVEIPYYVEKDKSERVYEIEGYTYNLEKGDAKISRLDVKNIFHEKSSEHWEVLKFALPDVKEGSVIEYRYKIVSPYFFNLRDWEFQNRIPVAYSEYTARMIPFYEYTYILQGATKFDIFRNNVDNLKQRFGAIEYPDNIFVFGMKNVPAFRDEQYITSINDYIMKLDFQLSAIHHPGGGDEEIMTTWPLLIQEILKQTEFGTYMKSASKNAEDIIHAMDFGTKTNTVKTEMIFNYVKSNYNWSGSKDKFASKSAKDFLRSKTGNCADMNLFLCGMLNAAGIQALPVLISTRDHGKIMYKYSFQHFLNYVIVLARTDDRDILLDATEPLSPFGILPTRCINEKGLVVNKEKVEWIPLVDTTDSESSDSIHVTFNENRDSARVDYHLYAIGHKALDYRKEYQTKPETFKKELLRDGIEFKNEGQVQNETVINLPFIYDYSAGMAVETAGNKLLIEPFPGLAPSENPLKLPFRAYPVDMVYRNKQSFITTIDIPEGYKYVEQNKNVSMGSTLANMQYTIEKEGGKIKVTGSYEYKKPVYQNYEYYELKGFMNKIVETFNDKIILEKI